LIEKKKVPLLGPDRSGQWTALDIGADEKLPGCQGLDPSRKKVRIRGNVVFVLSTNSFLKIEFKSVQSMSQFSPFRVRC